MDRQNIKIIIVGFPKTGKITLAKRLGQKYNAVVKSTDSLLDRSWEEISEEAANWINEPAPWVIEGNATARGLRKWLKLNPGKRLDGVLIVLLTHTSSLYTPKQLALAKAIRTVWEQIRMELVDRGAKISSSKVVYEIEPTKERPVDTEKRKRYRV